MNSSIVDIVGYSSSVSSMLVHTSISGVASASAAHPSQTPFEVNLMTAVISCVVIIVMLCCGGIFTILAAGPPPASFVVNSTNQRLMLQSRDKEKDYSWMWMPCMLYATLVFCLVVYITQVLVISTYVLGVSIKSSPPNVIHSYRCDVDYPDPVVIDCINKVYNGVRESCKIPFWCASQCDVEVPVTVFTAPLHVRQYVAATLGEQSHNPVAFQEPRQDGHIAYTAGSFTFWMSEMAMWWHFLMRTLRVNRYQAAYRISGALIAFATIFGFGVAYTVMCLEGHETIRSPYNSMLGGAFGHVVGHVSALHAVGNTIGATVYAYLLTTIYGVPILPVSLVVYYVSLFFAYWMSPQAFPALWTGASGWIYLMMFIVVSSACSNYSRVPTLRGIVCGLVYVMLSDVFATDAAHAGHLLPLIVPVVVQLFTRLYCWCMSSPVLAAGVKRFRLDEAGLSLPRPPQTFNNVFDVWTPSIDLRPTIFDMVVAYDNVMEDRLIGYQFRTIGAVHHRVYNVRSILYLHNRRAWSVVAQPDEQAMASLYIRGLPLPSVIGGKTWDASRLFQTFEVRRSFGTCIEFEVPDTVNVDDATLAAGHTAVSDVLVSPHNFAQLYDLLRTRSVATGVYKWASVDSVATQIGINTQLSSLMGDCMFIAQTESHSTENLFYLFKDVPYPKWRLFTAVTPSTVVVHDSNFMMVMNVPTTSVSSTLAAGIEIRRLIDGLTAVVDTTDVDVVLQLASAIVGIKNATSKFDLLIVVAAYLSSVAHSTNPRLRAAKDYCIMAIQSVLDGDDAEQASFDAQVNRYRVQLTLEEEASCVLAGGTLPPVDHTDESTAMERAREAFGFAKKSAAFIMIASLVGKHAVKAGPRAVNLVGWLGSALELDDAVSSIISVSKVLPSIFRYIAGHGSPEEMLKFGDKAAIHAFYIDRAVSVVVESPNQVNCDKLSTILLRASMELARASGPSAIILKSAICAGEDVLRNSQRTLASVGAPGIWLTGPPGVGKSQVSIAIAKKIAMSLGRKAAPDVVLGFVAQGGVGDKFDSGVPAGADAIILDDPVAAAQPRDQVTAAVKMMSFMDPRALLNKAELSDKGSAVAPWVVIVSTNTPATQNLIVSEQVLAEPKALNRRLALRITCTQKLSDITVDGKLDFSRVRWRISDYDPSSVTDDKLYMRRTTAEGYDMAYTTSDMMNQCVLYAAAQHKQKQLVLDLYSDETLMAGHCDTCYAITELCDCKAQPTPQPVLASGPSQGLWNMITIWSTIAACCFGFYLYLVVRDSTPPGVAEAKHRIFTTLYEVERRKHGTIRSAWNAWTVCNAVTTSIEQPGDVEHTDAAVAKVVAKDLLYIEVSHFVSSKLGIALMSAVLVGVVAGFNQWRIPILAGGSQSAGRVTRSSVPGEYTPFVKSLYLFRHDDECGSVTTNASALAPAVMFTNAHSFRIDAARAMNLRVIDHAGALRDSTQVATVSNVSIQETDSQFIMSAHLVKHHLSREMMHTDLLPQAPHRGSLLFLDPGCGIPVCVDVTTIPTTLSARDAYGRPHAYGDVWFTPDYVVPLGACNGYFLVDGKVAGIIVAYNARGSFIRPFSWHTYRDLAKAVELQLPLPGIPLTASEATLAAGFDRKGCRDGWLPLPKASWKYRWPESTQSKVFDHVGSYHNDIAESRGSGRVAHPDVQSLEAVTGVLQSDYMPVAGNNWLVDGKMTSIIEVNLLAAAECYLRPTPGVQRVDWQSLERDFCDTVMRNESNYPADAPRVPLSWDETVRGVPNYVGPTDPSTSAGPGEGPKRNWFYRDDNEAWQSSPGLTGLCDRLAKMFEGDFQPVNVVRMTPKTGEVLKCTKVRTANTRVFYQNSQVMAMYIKAYTAPFLALFIKMPEVGSIYGINMYSTSAHDFAERMGAHIPGRLAIAADDKKMDLHQLMMLVLLVYRATIMVAQKWDWPGRRLHALAMTFYAIMFPWIAIRGDVFQWVQGMISGVYGTTEFNTMMTFLKMCCISYILKGRRGYELWCASAKGLYGDDQLIVLHDELAEVLTPEVWRSLSLELGYETTSERDKTRPPEPASLLGGVTILKRTFRQDNIDGRIVYVAPLEMSSIVKAIYYPRSIKGTSGEIDAVIFSQVCETQERELWLHGRDVYDKVVPCVKEAADVIGARYAPKTYDQLTVDFFSGKLALWQLDIN